jgi:hypothetical protein
LEEAMEVMEKGIITMRTIFRRQNIHYLPLKRSLPFHYKRRAKKKGATKFLK